MIDGKVKLELRLFMRFFVALILLVAAVLKAHQLITTPLLGEGLLHARWFNIFVVEFEIFFGIWLIFGLLPKLSWLASIGLFSMLSVISFYKAVILKETSCGCFGATEINPWFTTALDLMIVAILVVLRPKEIVFKLQNFFQELGSLRKFRLGVFIATWLFFAVLLTFLIVSTKFVALAGDSKLSESEKSVTLEPGNWLGKKFPLLEYIEVNNNFDLNNLQSGEWTILLYHNDCLKCQEIFAKLKNQNTNENLEKLVVIEIPDKSEHQKLSTKLNRVKWRSLKSDRNWFVQTPVWIRLKDGNVVNVSTQQLLKNLD
ncbi:MAG: hypothetical protein LBP59_17535 [Planctomycetaceae bacterium]|jgi:hypothetical protein|nr:hypothetical protein [Planctomycetaceae bacterium]